VQVFILIRLAFNLLDKFKVTIQVVAPSEP